MKKKLKDIARIFVVALQFQVASSLEKRLETHFEGNLHGKASLQLFLSLHQPLSSPSKTKLSSNPNLHQP